MRRAALFIPLLVSATAVVSIGCGNDINAVEPRALNRPSDMAISCFGDLLLNSGDVITSSQPASACVVRPPTPEGEPSIQPPALYGFSLETGDGTVALLNVDMGALLDSDPLVPGKNSIPVGVLPVAIETDPSGCQVVVANAGTCDLSVLDVKSAVDNEPSVTRTRIVNASGEPLLARPRDLAAQPGWIVDAESGENYGLECPSQPVGLYYIAYPACNAVAVVDGTGQLQSAIQFADNGVATIVDDLTCAVECGAVAAGSRAAHSVAAAPGDDGGAVDAGGADAGGADAGSVEPPPPLETGAPRPGVVHMQEDGKRLLIGAENFPAITVVELDEQGLPVVVRSIALEGQLGVTALTSTGPIEMGGATGTIRGTSGTFEFAYAVGTDRSVRVGNIRSLVECDTQVDPRYLHDTTNYNTFSCFTVGDPETPPRRAGAGGPGIVLPRGTIPLDVQAFVVTEEVESSELPSPLAMVGHFALISASDGQVYVVNVDDDHQDDFEELTDLSLCQGENGRCCGPQCVDLPLALPHQLRDRVNNRQEVATTCDGSPDPNTAFYGARAGSEPLRYLNGSRISSAYAHWLPRLRHQWCEQRRTVTNEETGEEEEIVTSSAVVSELDFRAQADTREFAFPDLAKAVNEDWTIVYEGVISRDTRSTDVDGPTTRVGVILEDGGEVQLVDGSGPFCEMGVEEFDIARLLGCQVDGQCSVGETCVYHRETPSVVDRGMCFPDELADTLEERCRDLLISYRQYSVTDTQQGHLTLTPRRRVLRTTPLDGCDSEQQCVQLAALENVLPTDIPPDELELESADVASEFGWSCGADPSRAAGIDRCMMTCKRGQETADGRLCEDGFVCSDPDNGGYCIAGPLPSAECAQTLERYEVRVGEAFAMVSRSDPAVTKPSGTGYLHNRVVDPDTGACVISSNPNPLLIGRIPLVVPECSGDGLTDLTPNPCLTMVEEVERSPLDYEPLFSCTPEEKPDDVIYYGEVPAIRVSNPAFTLHLTFPYTTGDANCFGDYAGEYPPMSPVYQGFTFNFTVAGGFLPMFVTKVTAAHPIKLVKGPRGRIWVMDQGDVSGTGTATRGRVIGLDPDQAANNWGDGSPLYIF